jgi:hypothetical protein
LPTRRASIEAIAGLLPPGDWIEAMADEGDYAERLEPIRRIAAPDLEVVMIGPGGSFTQSFNGVDGVRDAWSDWLEPFASYTVEPEELREATPDRFVFLGRQIAVPKGGGTAIESSAAAVFFFRGELLSRIEFHLDRAAAMRAAGLED